MFEFLKNIGKKRRIQKDVQEIPDQLIPMDEVTALLSNFVPGIVAQGRSVSVWGSTHVDTLHRDIYHLIDAVVLSTRATKYREKPDVEVTKSRNRKENLTSNTLTTYFVDHEGRTGNVNDVFVELKEAVERLLKEIKKLEVSDPDNHDYYLRQNTNLFEELAMLLRLYISVS